MFNSEKNLRLKAQGVRLVTQIWLPNSELSISDQNRSGVWKSSHCSH